MKKNTMMRVASVLLIAVLLSTCAISGTFAKYVTQGSAFESARVAKWGVEFQTTSDMFQKTYDYQTQPTGVTGTLSVKSTDEVVAPGTSGTGYELYTTGTPEVSYRVTFELDPSVSETVYLNDYYPVIYTVTLDSITYSSNSLNDIAFMFNLFTYMYDVHSETYFVSNDNGSTWTPATGAPKFELSWRWDFETGHDKEDTVLGNLAAGYTVDNAKTNAGFTGAVSAYNTDIYFEVTATATQID